ncbi:hypothetical protein LPTSP3_g28960 [Leptospira kobayashii]|uniref:DUF1853 family protein n=1 Tax=Leptospira kobayashii TaxID=1917830 RepID=A0ABN6KIQ8_9LEPT|nr:DUF1853 family protein [Leptospira kobayashii]BDA79966.1 hypothetical protein LPTSP3_g28960 [Leptospira kobayashii]
MDKASLLLDLLWALDSRYLIQHASNFPDAKRESLRSDLIPNLTNGNGSNLANLEFFPILESGRLGRYFESLLEFIFLQSNHVQVLGKNVPIRNSERTLGEFDFLLKWEEENIHLEVALKFYLKLKKEPNLSSYIGPSGVDRLDLKLAKLLDNQMALSQRSEGKEYLRVKYGKTFIPMIWFVGFLFYPIDEYLSGDYRKSLLNDINFDHRSGFWILWENRLQVPQTKSNSYFSIPSRLSWLMSYSSHSDIYTYNELIQFLRNLDDPGFSVLIVEWEQVGIIPKELSRGFLVSRKLIESVSLIS